mmetsp:Transcript_2453/g.4921  ORF Transcript_2453/g.4921 Transcript_2453/m.4921 type:complete len:117 (+) Transcript_2453:1022-1372(+)
MTKSLCKARRRLWKKSKLDARIMIDCSHGNSKKLHTNQPLVAEDVCKQIEAGERSIIGFMIESHLNEGKQTLNPGVTDISTLKRGVSVTDACIDFAETEKVVRRIASAVKARRDRS